MNKKLTLLKLKLIILISFILTFQVNAQYYNSALGLNGVALKSQLHQIIKNHNAQAWPLWSYFYNTDNKGNNMVWDIYSDVPGNTPAYTFQLGANQCGTYNKEGDCYNHEHSWPSTYFSDGNPMRTDLHHIFPTDGYVNNKRSNYPYGKVNNANWTSSNSSKLGTSTSYIGYADKVFEPIDEYKGDVARAYFYMSTRYESEDAGWQNWAMANGAQLTPDAITLLLNWHHSDPVSQKEIDRNAAIYLIQNNRNPFIDYPIFADCIWGTADCTPLDITNISGINISMNIYPNPATNNLSINCPNVFLQKVTIYDMRGNVFFEIKNINTNSVDISIHDFPEGNYCIFFNTEKGNGKKLFTKVN